MEKDKHLGLRIDSETHEKLKSLAEYEGRIVSRFFRKINFSRLVAGS